MVVTFFFSKFLTMNSKLPRAWRLYSTCAQTKPAPTCPPTTRVKAAQKPPQSRKARKDGADEFCNYAGRAQKTDGGAFIVRQEVARAICNEDVALRRIEAGFDTKHKQFDPMPRFKTVGQRLIDLCRFGLHPNYRLYQTIPKRCAFRKTEHCNVGKTMKNNSLPSHLSKLKRLMEKRNIPLETKEAHAPQQIMFGMENMTNTAKQNSMLKKLIKSASITHVCRNK